MYVIKCVIWKGELICSCKLDFGKVVVIKIKKLFDELEEYKFNKLLDVVEWI